jgi:hypothetical protein
MTKSKLVIALMVSGLTLIFAKPLFPESSYRIQYKAEFPKENLSFDKLKGYDRIRLVEGTYLEDVAKPMLPAREIRIAVPAGMKVTNVYAADVKSEEISGEYNIYPAQPPAKTNISEDEIKFVEPDVETYRSTQPYPSKLVEFIRQSDLAGQGIAHIMVYPLQYVPGDKRLKLYTSINLVLEGTPGYEYGDYLPSNISEKDRETYEEMVKEIVTNPEDVQLTTGMKLGKITALPPGSYAHVIITSSTYAPAFQPLVEWHNKKGVKDTVVYTTDIYINYSGETNQEKIRNFIIDAHTTWGATYYLLGGENATVPFEFRTYYDESAPSDQYYSDYDDDWIHEVFVGRLTGASTGAFTTSVDKILKYEKDPPRTDYPLDVLLVGMDLDASTPTEDLKQTIASYIPARFNITKVYDSYAGNHRTDVIDALNAGQNLVNHSDHSNFTSMCTGYVNHSLCLNNNDIDALTNDNQPSIIVSTGCDPNGMDYADCIAEHFIKYNPNQAGVAFTGNTRSGWYTSGNPYSLTSALDMQWWAGLFSRNKYRLGQALVDSKHNYTTSTDIAKQCEWVFNLQGEPEMPIWTDDPDSFAVTFPPLLPVGSSSFQVHVEDSTTHTPVNQAYVCLWKGNEVYLTGYTNSSGNVTFNPSPATQGTMYVTVTKQNYLPSEGQANAASPILTTQEPTSVEENTATINGRLDNDGGYEAACWLFWDTDSGEPYANSESLGVFTNGSEFSKELTGLSEGTLYYYAAKGLNIAGWGSGDELKFLTKPLPPTGLSPESVSTNTIKLDWNKPISADRTIIERNDTLVWVRGEGTVIYNDTGSNCKDTALAPLTQYYYQAWSYSEDGGLYQYSDDFDTTNAVTLFQRGDANGDRAITVTDAIYLINYLFKGGPEPQPLSAGDANCDSVITVSDVVYLINYLFKGGPPSPVC